MKKYAIVIGLMALALGLTLPGVSRAQSQQEVMFARCAQNSDSEFCRRCLFDLLNPEHPGYHYCVQVPNAQQVRESEKELTNSINNQREEVNNLWDSYSDLKEEEARTTRTVIQGFREGEDKNTTVDINPEVLRNSARRQLNSREVLCALRYPNRRNSFSQFQDFLSCLHDADSK